MDKHFIGIDLCQHVPCIHNKEGLNSSHKFKNMPVALLAYYQNDKSVFGPTALNHRRGRGWDWPPEAIINLANEHGKGCGRVPIIAAFANLYQMEKSWGASSSSSTEDFHWSPNKKISEKASKLVVGSCLAFADNSATQMVLVIPDRFQEYSQERLKNKSNLKFIPRSIALAMRWIEEFYPNGLDLSEEGYVGHIRVCSFGLDEWTVYHVPLKIIKKNTHSYLVPVFNPMQSRHSVGLWGITYSCLSALVEMPKDNILNIWKEVITGTYLDDLQNSSSTFLESHCSKIWAAAADSKINQRLSECLSKIPHFKNVPSFFPSKQQLLIKISEMIRNQYKQLPTDASKLMGVIVDGSFNQMPFQNGKSIGGFIAQIGLNENPKNMILQTDLSISKASEGAANFGKRFDSGLPTYQSTLIPIDIYCRTDSENGWAWIPLIENDLTLDAGKREDLHDVTGFSVTSGNEEMKLTLRRPKVESEKEEFDYRIVSVKISKSNANIPVKLCVKVKPGDGFAEVEVKSDNGEIRASLDWTKMEECEEPLPPKLGYLPNLNKITPHLPLWNEVNTAFHLLELIKAKNTQKFENALNDLLKTLRKSKVSKDCFYESFGPVSSNGLIPDETYGLDEIQNFLLDIWENHRKFTPKVLKSCEQCMGWLFLSAPESFKKEIRQNLCTNEINKINRNTLNCVGKIFQDPDDIRLFFQIFQKKIQLEMAKPTYWIMALNNIVRFREKALSPSLASSEFLNEVICWLNEILKAECEKKTCQRIAIRCVRSLSYLLYRRKFETNFLNPQSHQFQDIESTLQQVLKFAKTSHTKNIIKTILSFLRTEATEADAALLYQDDTDGDDDNE